MTNERGREDRRLRRIPSVGGGWILRPVWLLEMRVVEGTSATVEKVSYYLNTAEPDHTERQVLSYPVGLWTATLSETPSEKMLQESRDSHGIGGSFRPVYRGSSGALSALKIDWLCNRPGQHHHYDTLDMDDC